MRVAQKPAAALGTSDRHGSEGRGRQSAAGDIAREKFPEGAGQTLAHSRLAVQLTAGDFANRQQIARSGSYKNFVGTVKVVRRKAALVHMRAFNIGLLKHDLLKQNF